MNTAPVQNGLGVELNYTSSNQIYNAFLLSGDFAYSYLPHLEQLLEWDVQVTLVYGDADMICSWPGGEEILLVANWTGKDDFGQAGYTEMMVDGEAYGETRQFGKLSFTRVWEAGHEVPCEWRYHSLTPQSSRLTLKSGFQPEASLAIFNRSMSGLDIATGMVDTTGNSSYASEGTRNTTRSVDLEMKECDTAAQRKRL